jgi:hypothetical protein
MVCALVEPTIMAATSRKKSRMGAGVRVRASFQHTTLCFGDPSFRFPLSAFGMHTCSAGPVGSPAGALIHSPEHNSLCFVW